MATRPKSPAPAPTAITDTRGAAPAVKKPLLRMSQTLNPPGDHFPLSLEIIVLSETGDEEDDIHQAQATDLPELGQAGWRRQLVGPLEVCFRVIS